MSNEREFTHLEDIQTIPNNNLETASTMSAGQERQWQEKLVGKKITEDSGSASAFSKRDLPEKHRVIAPGTIVTRDWNPDRLNVHVDDEGTCSHVTMG